MSNAEYFRKLDAGGHPFPELHSRSLNAPKGHRNSLNGDLTALVTLALRAENILKPKVVHIPILETRGPM